jgi:hypothetical protein
MSFKQRALSSCFIVLLAGMIASTAAAQQAALPETLTSAQALSGDQIEQLRGYVQENAGQLLNGSPAQSANARANLIEPLQREEASDDFVSAYSEEVAGALRDGLDREEPIVRLNTMVVTGQLSGAVGADLAAQAVGDESPAVRYWGAKAASRTVQGAGSSFTESQQATLLSALRQAIETEQSPFVLEQMYAALANLDIPEARAALINELERRAQQYFESGTFTGLRVELVGVQRLNTRTQFDIFRGELDRDAARQAVIVSAKYLQVIARAMENEAVPERLSEVLVERIDLIEQTLNWAIRLYNETAPSGRQLAGPLRQGNTPLFLINLYEWVGTPEKPGLLTTSALNIPYEQLALQGD